MFRIFEGTMGSFAGRRTSNSSVGGVPSYMTCMASQGLIRLEAVLQVGIGNFAFVLSGLCRSLRCLSCWGPRRERQLLPV